MNKKFLAFLLAITVGVAACNNDADNTAANDSTDTTGGSDTANTGAVTNNTSETDYAAKVDEYNTASAAGNFLDPRTGKSIKVAVDPSTGRRYNPETGEPVWRYVDKRTWWLYGGDDWEGIGEARMEGNKLQYKGDNDQWMTYEQRWPNDATEMKDWKTKVGNTKIKVSKDGDIKIKDKETGDKVKYDADDNKVKTDTSRR
jgi:hypothetical protein